MLHPVLVFALFYLMSPKHKGNDTGYSDMPKRDRQVVVCLFFSEKVCMYGCMYRKRQSIGDSGLSAASGIQ